MTDGQVFYLGAVCALTLGVIVEHYWKRWRR